jgi:hypothetical protein
MDLQIPTLHERILTMTDEELEDLATGESLAIAESSKLEGLVLDQDRIRAELLTGFRVIRNHKEDFVR